MKPESTKESIHFYKKQGLYLNDKIENNQETFFLPNGCGNTMNCGIDSLSTSSQ